MRSTVNSVSFYSSMPTTTLDTDKMSGEVTVQCCDEFDSEPNCEAVEIELTARDLEGEVSFFSTLNYDSALFLANSIIKILEIQKLKIK